MDPTLFYCDTCNFININIHNKNKMLVFVETPQSLLIWLLFVTNIQTARDNHGLLICFKLYSAVTPRLFCYPFIGDDYWILRLISCRSGFTFVCTMYRTINVSKKYMWMLYLLWVEMCGRRYATLLHSYNLFESKLSCLRPKNVSNY